MALDKYTFLLAAFRKVQKIGKRLKNNRTSNKAGFCKEIDSRDLEKTERIPGNDRASMSVSLFYTFYSLSAGPLLVGLLS